MEKITERNIKKERSLVVRKGMMNKREKLDN